jgi:SnoaL-like polyketide cyclase
VIGVRRASVREFRFTDNNRSSTTIVQIYPETVHSWRTATKHTTGEAIVSKEEDNKAVVGRWFTDFWGKTCKLGIVDELAAPDMLLQYSLHEPRRGREDIKSFMTDFRKAFPDLNF